MSQVTFWNTIQQLLGKNEALILIVTMIAVVVFYSVAFFKILNRSLDNSKHLSERTNDALENFQKEINSIKEMFLYVVQIRHKLDFLIQNFEVFGKIVEIFKNGNTIYEKLYAEMRRTRDYLIKNFTKTDEDKSEIIVNTCYRNMIDSLSNSNIDSTTKEKIFILIEEIKILLEELIRQISKLDENFFAEQLITSYTDNLKSMIDYFRIESIRFQRIENKDEIGIILKEYFQSITKKRCESDDEANVINKMNNM